MSSGKKILIGIFLIPLILLLILAFLWNPNWFKSSVTTHTEDIQGHSIQFDNIDHSLFSPGELTIHEISITGPIASGKIDSLVVSADVMKALDKDILIHEITLNRPDLQIDMEALNALVSAKQSEESENQKTAIENQLLPINSVFIKAITIKDADIKDVSELEQFSISGLNLVLSKINAVENSKVIFLEESAPLNAALNIDSVKAVSLPIGHLSTKLTATKQTAELDTFVLKTEKSVLDLSATVTITEDHGGVNLVINPSRLNAEEFHHFLNDVPVKPFGDFALSGNMTTEGPLSDTAQLINSLTGDISIGLQQGKLEGIDVNEIVAAFKDSKETDLKDIGGFLLTGPVGILAANLLDLGGGAKAFEGETLVPHMQINGSMESGSIALKDTAVATDQFRLAFDGGFNPIEQTFDEFTFAILDENGCAELTQTLNGDMAQPTSAVAKSLLDSAIAPITGLLKGVKDTGTDCEPFYTGSVPHPVE